MYDEVRMGHLRAAIKRPYSPEFGKKVDKMSNAQVLAIYKRLVDSKKIKAV